MTFRFPEERLAITFADTIRPDARSAMVNTKSYERFLARVVNDERRKFPLDHVPSFPWRDDDDWAAGGNDWGSNDLRIPDCEVIIDAPDDVLAAAAWLAECLEEHIALADRVAVEAVNDEVVSDCDCGAWYTYREWATLRIAYYPGEDWEARRCASCDAVILACRQDMHELNKIWWKGNPHET